MNNKIKDLLDRNTHCLWELDKEKDGMYTGVLRRTDVNAIVEKIINEYEQKLRPKTSGMWEQLPEPLPTGH